MTIHDLERTDLVALDGVRIMESYSGAEVLILGAGRQGIALARWLSVHGANVTISDQRPSKEFEDVKNILHDLPIQWTIGGHPIELLDGKDLLCLSGGIPLDLPIVKAAVDRGIPLSNDTQIFMETVPCQTIGITGSAGKSTTTALVGRMADLAFGSNAKSIDQANVAHPTAYTGGNIGDPLINHLDRMGPEDLAILEISSFQLDQMTLSPTIAVILNITPNHLDRHGTMAAYSAAKSRILAFQSAKDTAVLNRDDPTTWSLRGSVQGKLLAFSLEELEPELDGAYLQDGLMNLRIGKSYIPLIMRERIKLRGDHNISNVLAACTIGYAAGFPLDAMLEAAETFTGIPHRLEPVRELNRVQWYNDSIATTPERSMAAIKSFSEPIVLLLGGRDKNLPWEELANLIHKRVDHVILFGEAAQKIENVIGTLSADRKPYTMVRCDSLKEAVSSAAEVAEPGDVVLLSPGGTSFDAFKDFEERGEKFKAWVQALS